jgi:hypothetical protein
MLNMSCAATAALPAVCVQCGWFWWFLNFVLCGMLLRYFVNDFGMVPVPPIIRVSFSPLLLLLLLLLL